MDPTIGRATTDTLKKENINDKTLPFWQKMSLAQAEAGIDILSLTI